MRDLPAGNLDRVIGRALGTPGGVRPPAAELDFVAHPCPPRRPPVLEPGALGLMVVFEALPQSRDFLERDSGILRVAVQIAVEFKSVRPCRFFPRRPLSGLSAWRDSRCGGQISYRRDQFGLRAVPRAK